MRLVDDGARTAVRREKCCSERSGKSISESSGVSTVETLTSAFRGLEPLTEHEQDPTGLRPRDSAP